MPTYLTIPAQDEAMALALGARRDPDSGLYLVPAGAELAPFEPWLPTGAAAGALAPPAKGVSLTDLLCRIGDAVARALPRPEWVRFEISALSSKNGHMYLDVVDRDESGKELSKSRAIIWRGQANQVGEKFFKATGSSLSAGMKVLVLVQVQFNGQYGLSLSIVDVDPSFTLGDMEARLKRIREMLAASGDADRNRLLSRPLDFSNVAVISPEDAAGLGDFKTEADRLASAGLCAFTYFHAIFQGPATKDSMKHAFIRAHTTHKIDPFDALVVIRGGGAASDLHWLNEHVIAKMVCRFHAPVFTGIGHERDATILDEYANRCFGTPSKVIAHIKEAIAARANQALADWTTIRQLALARLSNAQARAVHRRGEIRTGIDQAIDRARYRCAADLLDIRNRTAATINVVAGKVDALHGTTVAAGRATLDLADTTVDHLSSTIQERALTVIGAVDAKASSVFDSVTLAARRSIDGIAEHLDSHWHAILDSAAVTARVAATESTRQFSDVRYYARNAIDDALRSMSDDFLAVAHAARREVDDGSMEAARHFADVVHFAKRMISNADGSAKDVMTGILAHGVEPTLRRGFAIVKANGKPVPTKASATMQHELEITFRDGSLSVKQQEK